MSFLDVLQKVVDVFFAVIPRKKPTNMHNAFLIAHRGVHNNKDRIENTLDAFEKALELGCWGVELDVQATKDHVLVVNHDATLQRLWHKNVAIAHLDYKELHHLAPKIPTLAQVVEKYGKRMHLFIEIKTSLVAEGELVKTLQELVPIDDYHLLSLNESLFSSFSRFPKPALLLVAGPYNVEKFCRLSLEKNYGGVLGHYVLLNKNKIKRLQGNNKQRVGVGFINSKFGLYRELNRGVLWLFSNNVSTLSRCLKKTQLIRGKPRNNGT
jgi:glycerophosphoryl diester phosphodiesterase